MKYLSFLFIFSALVLTGITFLFVPMGTSQTYQNISIWTSGSPSEPSIYISQLNTNYVVAGSNINKVAYSTNGGLTWTTGTLSSSLYGVWGDPCIIADTLGHFYYFHLSNPPSGGHWIDRIVCQKSTNNGVNWSNPGTYTFYDPNKDQDKEWACVDPYTNHIYCTWTQFDSYGSTNFSDSSNILFAKSTDGGNNWIEVKRINKIGGDCIDSDNTTEGAVPCTGPNGEVYVAWAGPLVRNNTFKIFFDRSTDGGVTWLDNDIQVVTQYGGWDFDVAGIYRANGMPVTGCDLSNGPYRGTIYINYIDSVSPGDHDVMLVKSTDGGFNWSSPVRVNNDPPGKEQFFTWMCIDQVTGYLYFVFYDRRNFTNTNTDVYIAKSTDGGVTFENILISASPFTPTTSVFFGDYTNISAHNGKVRPIWGRLSGSTMSVLTAIIDFPTGTENNFEVIPSDYKLYQNYPNPFNPTTTIKYNLPKDGYVSLKVYDILGKEVSVLVNTYSRAGTFEAVWDASGMSSGIYMYKLTTPMFSETKKMMLVR